MTNHYTRTSAWLRLLFMAVLTLTVQQLSAQQQADVDTLKKEVSELKKFFALFKGIKINGYAQPQWQYVDTAGAKSFEHGDFLPSQNNRFRLRRVRLKVAYTSKIVTVAIQLDPTFIPNPFVEAYGIVKEPFLKTFYLQGGQFNRPFGFEIAYSSQFREVTERMRMIQTLMPSERDLGFMIGAELPVESKWHFFRVQGGMFNGTSLTWNDFDKKKDFIGQIVLFKDLWKKNISLSGGFSYYNGGWRDTTGVVYNSLEKRGDTAFVFIKDTVFNATRDKAVKREYFGGDLQFSIKEGHFGKAIIRGELIAGLQPGSSKSTVSPREQPNYSPFMRNFMGAYVYVVQEFAMGKKFPHSAIQLAFRYDFYDPNTGVKGSDIGMPGSNLNEGDVRYDTYTLSLNGIINENFKIMVNYNFVNNEVTKLASYNRNLKDNVLTIRTQARF